MSLKMTLARAALRLSHAKGPDPDRYMAALGVRPGTPAPAAPPRGFDISRVEVAGHPVFLMLPGGLVRRRVIYFPGGAYVSPMRPIHWKLITALSQRLQAEMIVPVYPLAPEADFRATHAFAEAVLRRYGDWPFVMGGDSAGGNLALSMALRGRSGAVPTAERIFTFAPWLDLSCSNPKGPEIEKTDPMLRLETARRCGALWAAGEDPKSPLLSPLFGPADGLPPIDIHQGTADLCWPDAADYAAKLKSEGNLGEYFEYPGGVHVFAAATWLPESKLALDRVADNLGIRHRG